MEENSKSEEFIDLMIRKRKEENEAFLRLLEAMNQKNALNQKKKKTPKSKSE